MTYVSQIETPSGVVVVCYDDAEIDNIGGTARLLRDLYREGAHIAPSEIAAEAYRRENEVA